MANIIELLEEFATFMENRKSPPTNASDYEAANRKTRMETEGTRISFKSEEMAENYLREYIALRKNESQLKIETVNDAALKDPKLVDLEKIIYPLVLNYVDGSSKIIITICEDGSVSFAAILGYGQYASRNIKTLPNEREGTSAAYPKKQGKELAYGNNSAKGPPNQPDGFPEQAKGADYGRISY